MFDILLGRKFSNKCKHSVKCIKCRIEPIRKKKQVMVKYLRKDVADLLAGGHEANAFGRIDALIVEINHASCYDMIEQYCGCLLEHLSNMCKERECPKEAMEAVATLIFAAARFSDLPELTDLRSVFTKHYQTRMESCINKEFVEKIQNKSFSKVRKLEVVEDIAQEFSVNWNSNMFENKMSNQSAQVHGKALKHQVVSNENEKQFAMRALQKLQIKPEEQIEFQTTPTNVNNLAFYTIVKTAKMIADESENAKPEYTDKNAVVKTQYNQNENYRNDFIVEGKAQRAYERISLVATERQASAEVVPTKSTDGSKGNIVDHGGSVPSENVNEVDHNGQDRWLHRPVIDSSRKTFYPQPPYRKPNLNNNPNNSNYVNPTKYEKSAGGQGNMPKEEIFKDDSNLKSEIQTKQGKETARTNYIHGDVYYEQRFIVKKTPSTHRRHVGRRRTVETSEDAGYDKEEEIMDKLLMLYSKKGTNNEPRKSRTKLREAPKEPMAGAVPLPEHLDENGLHPKSLSRELTSSAENGFINRARATSKPTGTVPSRQPEIEIPAACTAQH